MLRGGAPANELDVTNVIVSCWKEFEISIPCNNPRCCDILAWGEERATFSVSWYHSGPIYWIFVYGNMSWHWLIPLCCTILSRKEYDVFTLKKGVWCLYSQKGMNAFSNHPTCEGCVEWRTVYVNMRSNLSYLLTNVLPSREKRWNFVREFWHWLG